MPIFKIKKGENPVEIEPIVGKEKPLEEFLEKHPIFIQKDMFIIGRQVTTVDQKYIDLLGIDESCSVIIIELKKDDKNQREVIAQILQYAEWIHRDVDSDELNQIAKKYFKKYRPDEEFTTLRKKFESTFGFEPESLNESQKLYIIAPEFDNQTIKVAEYLELQSLDINCLKVERHVDVDGTEETVYTRFVVGGERAKIRSDKPRQPRPSNFDWDYYTMYGHWEEKTTEEIQRICEYISKYSVSRGWKMQLEFNQSTVVFVRSPRELKEKFGDRRIIVFKKEGEKIRMTFNWLRNEDKKPDAKFAFQYDKSNRQWFFISEADGKLDLSSDSDFEKVLEQAYNATTER